MVFQFVVCENEAGQMKMPKPNKHGQTVLGRAKCFPAADRAVGAPDFSITLLLNWWELATDEQRRALVDHELCHCGLDDTGEYEKPMSVPHEFEGFHAELARHGPWDHNLQRVDKQLKLWDEGRAEAQDGITSVSFSVNGQAGVTINREDAAAIRASIDSLEHAPAG